MSSREIAELVGKDHKHVIRDIRAMLDTLEKDGSNLDHQFSESKDRRGYTTKFDLDRDLTETLITGYSVTLRYRVIMRLRELESALAEIAESKASRNRARLEAPHLTKAIKIQRLAIGKDLAPYVFSNEFDLINRTVLGMSSKQYRAAHGLAANEPIRDTLTPCQIFAIEHMQRLNASLIDIGLPFDQRKGKLCQVFVLQHQRALISETLRIEA
jgi:phage regulator Rha-like protein